MDNGFNNLREFGKFRLDVEKKVLWWDGTPVQLPPKEAELLSVLTDNAGEVVTKAELMERLWADSFVEESNLSRHVYRLRRIFEERGEVAGLIETVPRRGYRFTGAINSADADLVIERHSISRTLIENIDPREKPRPISATNASAPLRKWIFAMAGVVTLLAGVAAFRAIVFAPEDASSIRSIAVVPFRPLDSNSQDKGVAIADLLVAKLSNIRDLSIRPTSSVLRFVGEDIDVTSVGRDLSVDGVLEGSYRTSNEKLIVTARLVRASDRTTVWARDFDIPKAEADFAHDHIALQIADALAIDLSGRERKALEKRYSKFPDAMRMYQEARFHWNKRDNPGLIEAQRLFRNAAEADPDFALAYVGIADSHLFGPEIGGAEFALEKALSIDPELGEAYATRGFIRMFHKWDWDGAEADLRRAAELNPGYATAHQWHATLQMIRGRPHEAAATLRKAIEIDPINANLYADLAQAYYYAGDLAQAEESAHKALRIAPDYVRAHGHLSDILFAQARYEDAFKAKQNFLRELTEQPHQSEAADQASEPDPVLAFRKNGIRGYWSELRNEIEVDKDSNANHLIALAQAKMNLDETSAALADLELAIQNRAFLAPFLNADPAWHSLRGDARFISLMARMGL